LHGLYKALKGKGFEQVIRCIEVECLNGMFRISRGKNDNRRIGQGFEQAQTAQNRHLNI
jgi:hypothetical protein